MSINNHQKSKSSLLILIPIFLLVVFLSASFSGCSGPGEINPQKAMTGPDGNGNNKSEDSAVPESTVSDSPDITGSAMEKNTLIAASDATFPPFEFLEDGEVVGFDIDILEEIAARLEKEILIEQFHWDPEFKRLQEGEFDLVISAVAYNEKKIMEVDFSEPYFSMKYVLISLLGSEITVKDELVGKSIGIIESGFCCIDEDYLDRFEAVEYEDAVVLLEALKDKEIEAALISLPIAAELLKENEDIYYMIEEVPANKDFVIVFAKDNGLKAEFDAVLEDMREDGTYDEIYKKWFDYTSAIAAQD